MKIDGIEITPLSRPDGVPVRSSVKLPLMSSALRPREMTEPFMSSRPAGLYTIADPSSQGLATPAPARATEQALCSLMLKP